MLQRAAGAAYFFRTIRRCSVPSSVLMAPITQRFVDAIKRFADHNRIDIVSFRRGERKDDRTQEFLRKWTGDEGVLYIGKAQEKARVLRTERRHNPATGGTYAWLVPSTAMVNHYYFYFYFYAVDHAFDHQPLAHQCDGGGRWRVYGTRVVSVGDGTLEAVLGHRLAEGLETRRQG